jgi:hypothetical protein
MSPATSHSMWTPRIYFEHLRHHLCAARKMLTWSDRWSLHPWNFPEKLLGRFQIYLQCRRNYPMIGSVNRHHSEQSERPNILLNLNLEGLVIVWVLISIVDWVHWNVLFDPDMFVMIFKLFILDVALVLSFTFRLIEAHTYKHHVLQLVQVLNSPFESRLYISPRFSHFKQASSLATGKASLTWRLWDCQLLLKFPMHEQILLPSIQFKWLDRSRVKIVCQKGRELLALSHQHSTHLMIIQYPMF